MCGLAGVASTERRKYELARKDTFRQLLEAASWRGKDATGVACVKIQEPKAPAIIYKRAIKASDFIELEHYRRLERNFDEYGFVIGHARSSTSDGWNLADQNAHPFQCQHITLVHNGTIRNARAIGSGIEHPVDSAHVAAAMAQEEPSTLLPRLEGGFALVWHDARDGSLNFARNEEKPLFWCYVEGENTMFWGSELEAMYAVIHRHDYKIEGKFKHCSSYAHFKFPDMGDLRKFVRVPFGRPPSANRMPYPQHGAAWREETRRLSGPVTTTSTTSGSTPVPESSTKETSTDTTSGSPPGTDVTGTDKVHSLRPTSRRKLRAAQERLLQFGRKIDTPICFVPEQWWSYKNQRDKLGSIYGHDKVKEQRFVIGHVHKEVWGQALKAGTIYGRIVNVKRDRSGNGGYVIVCDYAPDLMNRFVFKPPVTSSRGGLDAGKPFPESVEALSATTVGELVRQTLSTQVRYIGPGNRRYTEKEFLEMVKHGCSYCARDISPEDHEDILWVGPHEQSPICYSCSGNKEVQVTLGIDPGV